MPISLRYLFKKRKHIKIPEHTIQTEPKSDQPCPEEVREAVLEILAKAALLIRDAGWSDNAPRCALEADHIHNLPGLLAHYHIDLLYYYLYVERLAYLRHLNAVPEVYAPMWEKLEQIFTSQGRG